MGADHRVDRLQPHQSLGKVRIAAVGSRCTRPTFGSGIATQQQRLLD
ncbi:hypothetical protein [Streptomyces chattanoogensis]